MVKHRRDGRSKRGNSKGKEIISGGSLNPAQSGNQQTWSRAFSSEQRALMDIYQRDSVPDEPLHPGLATDVDEDFKPCEEWPSFITPTRWKLALDDGPKRSCKAALTAKRCAFFGPMPLLFEMLNDYIDRRVRAFGVEAEGQDLWEYCVNQFCRFTMHNPQLYLKEDAERGRLLRE